LFFSGENDKCPPRGKVAGESDDRKRALVHQQEGWIGGEKRNRGLEGKTHFSKGATRRGKGHKKRGTRKSHRQSIGFDGTIEKKELHDDDLNITSRGNRGHFSLKVVTIQWGEKKKRELASKEDFSFQWGR